VTLPPYVRRIREALGPERIALPAVSGLVRDERGGILLVRHANDGLWVFPGGILDVDEVPAEGVVREIREETGLDVEVVRLLGVYGGPDFRISYRNGDEVSYFEAVFECRVVGGELSTSLDETLDVRFVAAGELPELALSSFGHAIVERTVVDPRPYDAPVPSG
jgi:ADP-ribose pyrophosphatase YjhB (NUDIX family)